MNTTWPRRGAAPSAWAQRMLTPKTAVILDFETCSFDGAVCEVAVIAADTGQILLDTLINPCAPISGEAQRVHGISDADTAGAPTFPQLLPHLERVCRGRVCITYNAAFDHGRVVFEADRWRLHTPLTDYERWDCAMVERSTWLGLRWRYRRLGGTHRALGDVQATRALLLDMAGPAIAESAAA
ncbi:exonuclease domain-containing protein [Tsukamurella hominis]|uniref:3'-5' exonuclease n=1 Tax=Tsukamurella hominis TaxID=1970232 RepID=UPI0039EB5F59